MLNAIPGIGWLFDLIVKASLAVPFWWLWTRCGTGAEYFAFLPPQFHAPDLTDTVSLFICLGILEGFSPLSASSSSESTIQKAPAPTLEED